MGKDMSPKAKEMGETMPEAISHLLEECRMVLPGIQALFGFQLIVVFNQGFWDRLSVTEQHLHLLAVALVSLAVALVMTPVAFHRQTRHVLWPEVFIPLSSRLLLWSMFPLMSAIAIDFYLIAHMVLQNSGTSLVASFIIFGVFWTLWVVLPRSANLRRRLAK